MAVLDSEPPGLVPLGELFGQRPGTLILVALESEMDRFAPTSPP